MINISTNINPITIISYLKSLNIQKHTTYAVGNSGPGLRQTKYEAGLKLLM
jgi:hypothetical protein